LNSGPIQNSNAHANAVKVASCAFAGDFRGERHMKAEAIAEMQAFTLDLLDF
jgi:hypothetical protein